MQMFKCQMLNFKCQMSIRLHFCRSVPPEFLWSFLARQLLSANLPPVQDLCQVRLGLDAGPEVISGRWLLWLMLDQVW